MILIGAPSVSVESPSLARFPAHGFAVLALAQHRLGGMEEAGADAADRVEGRCLSADSLTRIDQRQMIPRRAHRIASNATGTTKLNCSGDGKKV
jgi:hypothetical protein